MRLCFVRVATKALPPYRRRCQREPESDDVIGDDLDLPE
jgi:hypothetical protein